MNITEFDNERQKILEKLNILESHLKKDLNEIASLAAKLSGCPVSLLSFYDSKNQIIKAKVGFENSKLPRENSLCSMVLEQNKKQLVINDIRTNGEYSSHPFVKTNNNVRFYAGFPLYNGKGSIVGTLCVMDTNPRFISSIQLSALENLSAQATDLIIHKIQVENKEEVSSSPYESPHQSSEISGLINKSTPEFDALFKQMFKFSLIPTLIYDMDLNILSVNDSTIKELGYSRSELFKLKIFDLLPKSEQKKYEQDLISNSKEDNSSIQTTIKRKDGSLFRAEATQCKFELGEKTIVHVFIKNINEKIKMEKDNVALARIIQRSLNEIYIFDLHTLKFQYVNRGALQNIGYSMEEMRHLTPLDIKPEFSSKKFNEVILPLLKNEKEIVVFETVHKRRDNSLYNVEVHLQKMEFKGEEAFTAIIIDTTQKTQMIRENTALAQIIQRSLNEIYIFDIHTLKFEYVNKGALQNIGYSMEEMKTFTPLDIKPEYTEEKFKDTIQPLLDNKKELVVFETLHKRKDDSLYNVEVHLQKMEFNGKDVFTAIIIDTTDKTKNALQLKELNERIIKSNSRLKHFAAATAHDLQEPLRMVSSFSNILKIKYEEQLDEKANKYLHFIHDGSERMKDLIQNILEYTEIEAGEFEKSPVDLNKLLNQVVNDLEVQIKANDAKIHLPTQPLNLQSEYLLLYRVFLNLISNAIKYTAKDIKPVVIVEAIECVNFWKFAVKDNGIGIKKEYQEKVFQLFVRLHSRNEFKGTGMGLAIVSRIISLHNGRLWLESEEGKGSCFYFTIPK